MIPELSVTCPIVLNREEYVICLNINNFDMRKYLMKRNHLYPVHSPEEDTALAQFVM